MHGVQASFLYLRRLLFHLQYGAAASESEANERGEAVDQRRRRRAARTLGSTPAVAAARRRVAMESCLALASLPSPPLQPHPPAHHRRLGGPHPPALPSATATIVALARLPTLLL
jgi:hypothetical protein